MKPLPSLLVRSLAVLALTAAVLSAHATMTNTLPVSLAAPLGSSTNRGFVIRVAQAWSTNGPVANSYSRAYKQINGTLLDTNNLLIVNAANPGPNSDGSFDYNTINFEKDASIMDVTD